MCLLSKKKKCSEMGYFVLDLNVSFFSSKRFFLVLFEKRNLIGGSRKRGVGFCPDFFPHVLQFFFSEPGYTHQNSQKFYNKFRNETVTQFLLPLMRKIFYSFGWLLTSPMLSPPVIQSTGKYSMFITELKLYIDIFLEF